MVSSTWERKTESRVALCFTFVNIGSEHLVFQGGKQAWTVTEVYWVSLASGVILTPTMCSLAAATPGIHRSSAGTPGD